VVGIEKRVSDLEKAVGVADSDECTCPSEPGVSGKRVVCEYERPELHSAEELAWAEGRSDRVERCAVCGRVRPLLVEIYVENWRSEAMREPSE